MGRARGTAADEYWHAIRMMVSGNNTAAEPKSRQFCCDDKVGAIADHGFTSMGVAAHRETGVEAQVFLRSHAVLGAAPA